MELEQQFLRLLDIVERIQNKVCQLEEENKRLIRGQKQMLEWVEMNQQDNVHFQENISYELRALLQQPQEGTYFPRILPGEAAIEEIVGHGKSLARFGDGEFAAIAGRLRHRFQSQRDAALQERLKEVLQSEDENLLLGIADNYGSLEKYTAQAKREIRAYLTPMVRQEHLSLLSPQKTYYDAYVTRPYIIYQDSKTEAPGRRFQNLKRIWDGRRCILVEGKMTGLGVGNDLFGNAGSIQRILAPAENAFSRYPQILDACMEQPEDSLFLLALGPTATVLASDLCKAGRQAVDIGHVDLEYEWYLQGVDHRVPIEGKYNNEIREEQPIAPIQDRTYIGQVIADLSR